MLNQLRSDGVKLNQGVKSPKIPYQGRSQKVVTSHSYTDNRQQSVPLNATLQDYSKKVFKTKPKQPFSQHSLIMNQEENKLGNFEENIRNKSQPQTNQILFVNQSAIMYQPQQYSILKLEQQKQQQQNQKSSSSIKTNIQEDKSNDKYHEIQKYQLKQQAKQKQPWKEQIQFMESQYHLNLSQQKVQFNDQPTSIRQSIKKKPFQMPKSNSDQKKDEIQQLEQYNGNQLEQCKLSQNCQSNCIEQDKINLIQRKSSLNYLDQLNELVLKIPNIQRCQFDSNCEFIWIRIGSCVHYYCPLCDEWSEEHEKN